MKTNTWQENKLEQVIAGVASWVAEHMGALEERWHKEKEPTQEHQTKPMMKTQNQNPNWGEELN